MSAGLARRLQHGSSPTAPVLATFTRSPRMRPAIRKTFSTGLSIPLVARVRKPANKVGPQIRMPR